MWFITEYILVVVEKDESGHHQYRLTGIGNDAERPNRTTMVVPPEEERISYPAKSAGYRGKQAYYFEEVKQVCFIWFQFDDEMVIRYATNMNHFPHGYAIHAQCWLLTEMVMGREAEKYFNIFINTPLRKETVTEITCVDEEKHTLPSGKPRPNYVANDDLHQAAPANVPELEALITESHKVNRVTQTQTHESKSIQYRILLQPLEIQLLILDELCLCDLQVVAQALDWVIPQSYWRTRIARFPYFGVSSLKPDSKFDWEFFGLRIGPLLQTSSGLQNRRRIFKILEDIKQSIHQNKVLLQATEHDDDD